MSFTFRTVAEGELEPQISKCREVFEVMIGRATQSEVAQTLDEAERTLFTELMNLGREMLSLRAQAAGNGNVGSSARGPDGRDRTLIDYRTVQYRSVFGEISIRRAYYWAAGIGGFCPLDARLSLPETKDSYLLQEWALRMGVVESYDESKAGLADLLKLPMPKRQIEQHANTVGPEVEPFYESDVAPAPLPRENGSILVVEADGKGVPMKKSELAQAPKRLSKGQKRQKKRMAMVGTVFTTEPRGDPDQKRPIHHKEVFAELQKREEFGPELLDRSRRQRKKNQRKAFLADGQESLWDLKDKYFPEYVGILDWQHATEYLWKAAYLFLPESSPEARRWVERQKAEFRRGEIRQVIRDIHRLVRDGTIRGHHKRRRAEKIAAYFERNRERMRYDRYLRQGLPIGSGAVEGACKNLVKDRMEGSGMRWTIPGAQAMLNVRGAYLSGHWQPFFRYYRQAEHERLYGTACQPAASRRKGKAA